ncbi:bcl10-interacting CARD protein [Platysternon megacephalum]|uniref:Bcl10-interacting CARD protein n=1 Tax=Platysternon megacephalum TaxID=55544 RepID=A0A4D9EW18_9SAUR|nr:bcl10-interacting CARD protein [Platysternon megacephalum]
MEERSALMRAFEAVIEVKVLFTKASAIILGMFRNLEKPYQLSALQLLPRSLGLVPLADSHSRHFLHQTEDLGCFISQRKLVFPHKGCSATRLICYHPSQFPQVCGKTEGN